MSTRRGSVYAVHGRIERAQAFCALGVIKCEVWLTSENPYPGTKTPGLCQVRIHRQSTIHESNSIVELVGYVGKHIRPHTRRYRIICSQLHCFPGQPRSFGTLLHTIDHPVTRLALDV